MKGKKNTVNLLIGQTSGLKNCCSSGRGCVRVFTSTRLQGESGTRGEKHSGFWLGAKACMFLFCSRLWLLAGGRERGSVCLRLCVSRKLEASIERAAGLMAKWASVSLWITCGHMYPLPSLGAALLRPGIHPNCAPPNSPGHQHPIHWRSE